MLDGELALSFKFALDAHGYKYTIGGWVVRRGTFFTYGGVRLYYMVLT